MSLVRQRTWTIPGMKTKRKAWGFTVTVDGKRKRYQSAEWTKEQAQDELAKVLLQIEQEPKAEESTFTLAQGVGRYLAVKARKKTIEESRRHLKHLLSAFGGDTPLAALTANRISEYRAQRLGVVSKQTGQHLSAAAINRPLATLHHLLRLAHEEWEVLAAVPKIRREKESQGRLRWLKQEEITALLTACQTKSRNRELYPAVVIAINTGLRRGELLGLTWDRIDLSRGVLRLEVTKNGKRREVPLNGDSYRALVSLEPKAEGRVFRSRSIRTPYETAVRAAKLDDVDFHTLRHTFASWAIQRGVSLKELQELGGWSSVNMVMRYAHLAPEHLRTAVARLEGLTSGGVARARGHRQPDLRAGRSRRSKSRTWVSRTSWCSLICGRIAFPLRTMDVPPATRRRRRSGDKSPCLLETCTECAVLNGQALR